MTAERQSRWTGAVSIRSAIRAILFVQLAIGAFLVFGDLGRQGFRLDLPTNRPVLDSPVSPGDQTRRYTPTTPAPGAQPGVPAQPLPKRLQFAIGGDSLNIEGEIAPGDAERFEAFLAEQAEMPAAVTLNSTGGSVSDALLIGEKIREIGASTEVPANRVCLSACPYMLASGVDRFVHPDGFVGVHQHYFGESSILPAFMAVEDVQRGQGRVMAHLAEMGVDPMLMQPALTTPPDEIYILVPEELLRYRLATEMQG